MAIDIIYCAAGNRKYAEIAVAAGMRYGAQLPDDGKVYLPIFFADQNWKNPNRPGYMEALSRMRPTAATVLDWEHEDQFAEVMSWAEEAAQYVERVIIIPKIIGSIPRIPHRVGNADVILGYSVPTKFGGTSVPTWEFGNRPVHLLGGSPQKQLHAAHYMHVVSADGNYIHKLASKTCFWTPGNSYHANDRFWPTIIEADGKPWGDGSKTAGAPYEAFRRSCINVMEAWRSLHTR